MLLVISIPVGMMTYLEVSKAIIVIVLVVVVMKRPFISKGVLDREFCRVLDLFIRQLLSCWIRIVLLACGMSLEPLLLHPNLFTIHEWHSIFSVNL